MESPMPEEVSILIVEDEVIALEVIALTVAKKYPDVTVYKALDGRTGLDLFIAHTPDIVITDINMPEISGVQMAKKICEIKPNTKFIALTGDIVKLSLETSAGNGFKFAHFIEKPVDFMDLFAEIEKCRGEITQKNK
jgi:YesN/AraC family two-component response regulator